MKYFTVFFIIVFVSSALGDTCNTGCEVLVNIDSGPVCGRVEVAENSTKFYSFQGIPYAKPPTGARRFSELEIMDPWTEPFYALEEGPACPSRDITYGSITVKRKGMSDDCIYANVFVPATANINSNDTSEGLLPILVNIHGGGFQTGSGNRDMHGPELLIVKDVIVINFNYRLAIFGYLSLASNKIPGNNALRDMLTLLRWVQRNAAAFGGDSNRVTVVGDSAGAASVHLLMLSEASKGLFHKAIMMSGTAFPNFYSAAPSYAKYVSDLFLGILGVNSTDADEIHQILTELPLEDIMRANDVAQYQAGITTFVPVIEKEGHDYTRVVEANPIALIAEGRGNDIPLLMGFNKDEGEFFKFIITLLDVLNRYKSNPAVILAPRLAYELTTEEATAKGTLSGQRYFGDAEPTVDGFAKFVTEVFFQYPLIKLAQWRALLNSTSTYLYLFSYESDFSMVKNANWLSYKGTAHVEDLTYVFRTTTYLGDHVSIPPKTRDDQMRVWMSSLFSNFVKCNNPTCSESNDQWPPINKEELMYQVINEPGVYNMSSLSDDIKEMVDFYDAFDDEIRSYSEVLEQNNK